MGKKIIELLPLNLVVVGDLFFSPNLRYELPQVSSFKIPNEIFILTLLLKLCKSMWFLNSKEIWRKKGSLFHCILCFHQSQGPLCGLELCLQLKDALLHQMDLYSTGLSRGEEKSNFTYTYFWPQFCLLRPPAIPWHIPIPRHRHPPSLNNNKNKLIN